MSVVPLLAARGLRKTYRRGTTVFGSGQARIPERFVAIDGVELGVFAGETFAIVGESACGKTTLARMLLRLIEPDSGEIHFEGCDLLKLGPRELRASRREMQMVFQDLFASLNPRMRVGEIVQEPLAIHEPALTKDQREAKSLEILKPVGLSLDLFRKFPHEFSGG